MSSLPLKDGDKKREDVLDALNHTLQKWSYGKSPRWTFAERYIKGHISIHFKCTLRVPMETYPKKICVSFERGNILCFWKNSGIAVHRNDGGRIIVKPRVQELGVRGECSAKSQGPVFVREIEDMEQPKGVIRWFATIIRLNLLDNCSCRFGKPLHSTATDGILSLIIEDREFDISLKPFRWNIEKLTESVGQMIQGAPGVVDAVASDETPSHGREFLFNYELDMNIVRMFSVSIESDHIRTRVSRTKLTNFRVENIEMVFCPVQLV